MNITEASEISETVSEDHACVQWYAPVVTVVDCEDTEASNGGTAESGVLS